MKKILGLALTLMVIHPQFDANANSNKNIQPDKITFKSINLSNELKSNILKIFSYTPSENELYWTPSIVSQYLLKPFIHPELLDAFPFKLSDLLEKYSFLINRLKSNNIDWQDDYIFVIKHKWKYVLWYYKSKQLFLASYVSPGKGKSTPINTIFFTEFKQANKRSRKYDDAPMPYSIYLWNWWIFVHGWLTDWNKRSHGCFRLPYFFAQNLFNNVKWKIPFVFFND